MHLNHWNEMPQYEHRLYETIKYLNPRYLTLSLESAQCVCIPLIWKTLNIEDAEFVVYLGNICQLLLLKITHEL